MAPEGFPERARRLELSLDATGVAKGRWRRREIALDETGILRVVMRLEAGPEPGQAPGPTPPLLPTEVPELGVRSTTPSRWLEALERPASRSAVFALLARARTLEVGEAALVLQLEGGEVLPALKELLDRAVALAELLERSLAGLPPKAAQAEALVDPEEERVMALYQDRLSQLRRGLAGPLSVAVALQFGSFVVSTRAQIPMAILGALFGGVIVAVCLIGGVTVGCPSCDESLFFLWTRKRCPACDARLS